MTEPTGEVHPIVVILKTGVCIVRLRLDSPFQMIRIILKDVEDQLQSWVLSRVTTRCPGV